MLPTDFSALRADDAELERFAEIFDRLGIGFILYNADGVAYLRNAVANTLLGDLPATWVDESGRTVPPDSLPSAQAAATGKAVRDRIVGLANGTTPSFWIKATALPVFADDGSVRRVMLTLVDISKRKQLESAVQELSVRDQETGTFTYAYTRHLLEEEIHRARRYGTPFTLAVMEIDRLADIETQVGLTETDRLLAGLTRLAHKGLREIDIVTRKSRSKLLVLLPNVRMNDGIVGLERIRARIEAAEENAPLGITISGGVTEYAGESAEALIERAESLLLQARAAGPNHLCQDVDIF